MTSEQFSVNQMQWLPFGKSMGILGELTARNDKSFVHPCADHDAELFSNNIDPDLPVTPVLALHGRGPCIFPEIEVNATVGPLTCLSDRITLTAEVLVHEVFELFPGKRVNLITFICLRNIGEQLLASLAFENGTGCPNK